MKLRLTRSLLVAFVASCAISTTYAKGVYLPGQVLDAEDTSISSINAGAKTDVFAPSVKDGDNALTVSVSGKEGNNITAPVYSRGGELVFIGEGKDTTSMSVTPNSKGVLTGHAGAVLSAAGKNWTDTDGRAQYATVRVKDITLNTKSNHAITVGGADGNGRLVVDNAVLDNSAGTSLFIGYYSNRGNDHNNVGGGANGSGTYVTTDCEKTEDNRFYGDYQTINGKEFGRGVVTVTNGSTYNTGVSALCIGSGELSITEKSRVVSGWCAASVIGMKTGSIALVNIDNNSSWTVGKGDLSDDSYVAIGHGHNTTATVSVTNNSKFTSKDVTYVASHTFDGEEYSVMDGSLKIALQSTAELNKVYVGNDVAGKGLISVEAGSSIVAWEGAQDASIQVYSKGTVENSGTIDLDLVLTGGQLVANGGSEFAGIMAESGTITINGQLTLNGDLVLGSQVMTLAAVEEQSDAVTIIYNGGAIDLAGNNLTLGSGVVVRLAEGVTVEEELALFTNAANAQQLGELNIEVQDSTGAKVDGIKVTASIPEPTTATLSMLALAALAARRRRK